MAQRLGRCLNEVLSEIVIPVKMPGTHGKTERPRAPLLEPGVGFERILCRIGGSPGSGSARIRGGILEIPPCMF